MYGRKRGLKEGEIVLENAIINSTVMRCSTSAQYRPDTTTRSQSGIGTFFAACLAALSLATFSAGVSDEGVFGGVGYRGGGVDLLGLKVRCRGRECEGILLEGEKVEDWTEVGFEEACGEIGA